MQKEKLEFLKEKAAELRKDVITMIYEAQFSGRFRCGTVLLGNES